MTDFRLEAVTLLRCKRLSDVYNALNRSRKGLSTLERKALTALTKAITADIMKGRKNEGEGTD